MPFGRTVRRLGLGLVGLLVTGVVLAVGALWAVLQFSLPIEDGELELAFLSAPVTIERDALARPTITAASRSDAAAALGFLHAQERTFATDLTRRDGCGTLSVLVGAAAIEHDKTRRIHNPQATIAGTMAALPPAHRRVLEAYADGFNAGVDALGVKPWEYWLLGVEVEPYRPEDAFCALMSMWHALQDPLATREHRYAVAKQVYAGPMLDWMFQIGTARDTPLDESTYVEVPLPRPDEVMASGTSPRPDMSRSVLADTAHRWRELSGALLGEALGSNAFAVAGSRSGDGSPVIAVDMHLNIFRGPLWYVARTVITGSTPAERYEWNGVTLPGTPVVVSGKNSKIGWGLTNSPIDTSDRIIVETTAQDRNRYLVPGGSEAFVERIEQIDAKGGESVEFRVRDTRWGPIVAEHPTRPVAVRWLAHLPEANNLRLLDMERANSVAEAIDLAPTTGIPSLNLVVADERDIGWTMIGRIPDRKGFNGQEPVSWADGQRGWIGLLDAESYPQVVNPDTGYIVSANQRMVGGAVSDLVGDGGWRLAWRARTIRDRVASLSNVSAKTLLDVQLDRTSALHQRWSALGLTVLDREDALQRTAAQLLEAWSGEAGLGPRGSGYFLARAFRTAVHARVLAGLAAPTLAIEPSFDFARFNQMEGRVWTLVQERPAHLLAPGHASWEALLGQAMSTAIEVVGLEVGSTEIVDPNPVTIAHPLARFVPFLGQFLHYRVPAFSTDRHLPAALAPGFGGQSERISLAMKTGAGLFSMPGGQSGNPISENFSGQMHAAWLEDGALSMRPAETVARLTLAPNGAR